jgi:hypothetical protein
MEKRWREKGARATPSPPVTTAVTTDGGDHASVQRPGGALWSSLCELREVGEVVGCVEESEQGRGLL